MNKFKVFLLSVFVLLIFIPAGHGEMPSFETLKAVVRDIELPGDKFASLAIDMHMRLPGTPVHLFCRLRYQAEQNYSLHVFDGRDGTPVLIVSEQMALINDPFADTFSVIASSGVVFELQPQEGQYTANFAFNQPVDGQVKNKIRLDFTTMLFRLQENIEVKNASDGSILLSGATREKSRCLASISASATLPLKALSLFIEERDEPVIEFSLLEADASFSMPVFPLQELQKRGLAGEPVSLNGFLDTMSIMTSVIKGVFARAAIHDAEMRNQISQMLQLHEIDWEKLEKADLERGAILRELFPDGTVR